MPHRPEERRPARWYQDDNRACGSSFAARLDALKGGHGGLFFRSDRGDGPVCHRLVFANDGQLQRAGDGAGRPTLVFDYAFEGDFLVVKGPVQAQPTRTPLVQCETKFKVGAEGASSFALARQYQRGLRYEVWNGHLYYSEAACMAAPPAPLARRFLERIEARIARGQPAS